MNAEALRVELERRPDAIVVISLEGEVDLHTAPIVREAFLREFDAGARRFVIDVGGVTFMDSTALGVFVGGETRVRACKGRMAIVCSSPELRRVFETRGLWEALTFSESRAEALRLAAA
jgi:anti-sigma B factor antagonist